MPYRIVTLGVVALLCVAGCRSDDRELLEVGDDAAGTCLKVPPEQGPMIDDLPVVDCGALHTHEIYAVPRVEDDEDDVYPGFKALESFAQAACLREFEPYVGISAFDSSLFYSWIVPTLTSWDRENDREVLCVAGARGGGGLTGTVRNSER